MNEIQPYDLWSCGGKCILFCAGCGWTVGFLIDDAVGLVSGTVYGAATG